MTAENLPLSGIRVIEVGHTIMGPCSTMILADLGADVIKIEPVEGERTRRSVGFGAGIFGTFNRNKRSIAVNLKTEVGIAVARKLAEKSDVLVENLGFGVMDKLGLGYSALSEVNPGLIYCSLKGFLKGPYEKRAALDAVVQYMGGLAYMTGPRGTPLRAGASVVDITGGVFGVIGVLAAVHERSRTGKGQLISSGLFESTAFLVAQHMGVEIQTGVAAPPMPEKSPHWGVYETFKTADDKVIFIGITSDNHFRGFCTEFGLKELLDDPTLRTDALRAKSSARLAAIVSEIAGKMTLDELAKKLDELKMPFAPLGTPSDLFEDPHLNEGGRMYALRFPNGSEGKLPGLPFSMNTPLPLRYQPPITGEHTRSILKESGFCDAEITAMVKNKTIVSADDADLPPDSA